MKTYINFNTEKGKNAANSLKKKQWKIYAKESMLE